MESSSNQPIIFLDGCNFFQKFYPGLSNRRSPPNHWNLSAPFRRVRHFVTAMRRSGFQLQVFFDTDNVSEEAINKWTKRRQIELRKETNTLPTHASVFVGMFFRRCKVAVHYSYEEDNDDTIAAYAQYYQGIVLSADRDFFRYKYRDYDVYRDFEYTSAGMIRLIPHEVEKRKIGCKLRDILPYLPKTLRENSSKILMKMQGHRELRMGCPSQLVRKLGNPYLALRPLRQAAYYQFRIKEKKEYIPYWDEEFQEVEWDVKVVKPDKRCLDLLESPFDALEEFFQLSGMKKPADCSDKKWGNHIFNICVLTFDICSMIYDKSEQAFFDWLEEAKFEYQYLYSTGEIKTKNERIIKEPKRKQNIRKEPREKRIQRHKR